MTHLVWMGLWRAGMNGARIESGALYAAGVVLIVGALVIAWLMWKVVEEPAREWMRGLVEYASHSHRGRARKSSVHRRTAPRGAPIDPVAIPETDER